MKTFFTLLIGIILGALIFAGVNYFKNTSISIGLKDNNALLSPTPVNNLETTSAPTASPAANQTGFVEGTIMYPSEGIPKDLSVCAETLASVMVKCTNTHIADLKFKTGVGYKLELDPGSYYIYAKTPLSPYKAYYNEFVICGLLASCPSHKNIEVKVIAGETTSNIDPADWYNN